MSRAPHAHPSPGRLAQSSRAFGLAAVGPVVAVIATLFGDTAAVQAQPRGLALTWDVPEGCPTAAAVLRDVERTLAAPGQARSPIAVTAHVLARPGEPWRASLSFDIRGTRTERQFEAETCDAVANAVVLILSLALEENSEASTPAPESPSPGAPLPEPDAEQSPVWSNSWSAMVAGLVDWDSMPQPPAFGFGLAGGRAWRLGRWRLAALAGASFFPRHRLELDSYTYPYGRADFWLLSVSSQGCAAIVFSRFEVGPCLGAELAGMHVFDTGSQVEYHNSTHYWLSLAGSAVVSWNIYGKWGVVLVGEVVIPSMRPRFGNETANVELYRVPAVAGRVAFGIERRFE